MAKTKNLGLNLFDAGKTITAAETNENSNIIDTLKALFDTNSVPKITTSGSNWCIEFPWGWAIQGGYQGQKFGPSGSSQKGKVIVPFLKPFTDTTYKVIPILAKWNDTAGWPVIETKNVDSFDCTFYNYEKGNGWFAVLPYDWIAIGPIDVEA